MRFSVPAIFIAIYSFVSSSNSEPSFFFFDWPLDCCVVSSAVGETRASTISFYFPPKKPFAFRLGLDTVFYTSVNRLSNGPSNDLPAFSLSTSLCNPTLRVTPLFSLGSGLNATLHHRLPLFCSSHVENAPNPWSRSRSLGPCRSVLARRPTDLDRWPCLGMNDRPNLCKREPHGYTSASRTHTDVTCLGTEQLPNSPVISLFTCQPQECIKPCMVEQCSRRLSLNCSRETDA